VKTHVLYRLSRNRWFARLLSILAFAAALGLYDPTASFAIVYCKDNSPNSQCKAYGGTTCPPTSATGCTAGALCATYTTKCTLTGGTLGGGSEWSSQSNVSDVSMGTSEFSLCGAGYTDVTFDTVDGQQESCTYTADFVNAGQPQPAFCIFTNVVCPCNLIGACKGGTRVSEATCPTLVNGQNKAGCTGKLTVFAVNGTPLRQGTSPNCTGTDTNSPPGVGGCAIDIGPGVGQLDTNSECNAAYPASASSGLARRVASRLTQACTRTSSAADDPIVEFDGRSTNHYSTAAQAVDVARVKSISPADGYPAHSCSNSGINHITFIPVPPDVCNAANYVCGQDPTGAFGPNPSDCTPDPSTGSCTCTCFKCNEATGLTLANPGVGNQTQGKFPGLYLLISPESANAYEGAIEISGGP
jgi:hypothetical protein